MRDEGKVAISSCSCLIFPFAPWRSQNLLFAFQDPLLVDRKESVIRLSLSGALLSLDFCFFSLASLPAPDSGGGLFNSARPSVPSWFHLRLNHSYFLSSPFNKYGFSFYHSFLFFFLRDAVLLLVAVRCPSSALIPFQHFFPTLAELLPQPY